MLQLIIVFIYLCVSLWLLDQPVVFLKHNCYMTNFLIYMYKNEMYKFTLVSEISLLMLVLLC